MNKLTPKYQKVIIGFLEKGTMQSSDVYAKMIKSGENISLVTI